MSTRSHAAERSRDDRWRGIVKLPCETCGKHCEIDTSNLPDAAECLSCNGTGYRMPTDAEIEAWLAVNVKKWEHRGHCWHDPAKGNDLVESFVEYGDDFHPLMDANQALMLAPENLILDKEGDDWVATPQPPGDAGCSAAGTFCGALCLVSALATAAKLEASE